MALQALIFILLFGLLQGLLMLITLLRRRDVKPFHIFLCAYITVLLFQITLKSVSKIWVMNLWITGYSLSYYLPFLYGPLVYFIAASSTGHYIFKPKHLLHFSPFLLVALLFALNAEFNRLPVFVSYLFAPFSRLVLQLISLAAYHTIAGKVLNDFQHNFLHSFLPAHIDFAKRFVRTSLVITVLISCVICFMYISFPHYQYVKWSFVLLTFFIYRISLQAMHRPGSFEVVFGNAEANEHSDRFRPKLTLLHSGDKYANSGLKDEQANEILKALHQKMDTQRLFLDTGLTIDKLADSVACPKHHLSQVLNEKLGVSFNEYINRHRIEASKEMLSSPEKNHFTIASIAYDAGFNSLSTFNDVFKKITGITPSHYRKIMINEYRQQRI